MSDKIKHLRAKPEKVMIGEKEYTVKPKKMKNLLDLIEELRGEWDSVAQEELDIDLILELVQNKPVPIINKIVEEEFTEDDYLESYPNDIYNVVITFKEVNFTFLKRLKGALGNLIQFAAQSNPQAQQQIPNQE